RLRRFAPTAPAEWPWNGWPNAGGVAGRIVVEQVAEWRGMRTDEARFLLALKLFEQGRISSGKAAVLCGMGRVAFLLAAGRAGVPVVDLSGDDLDEEFA
ncbi:MAG: UPF0175 family protein, partial [Thiocapsa sp. C3-sup]